MTTESVKQDTRTKTYGLMALVKGTTPMVEKGPDNTVMSWPHLVVLEALVALGTTFFLLVFSSLANAPLKEIANPDVTENPAKAAWYFVGLQEMLLHMSPLLAGIVIPGALILVLLALPYLDRSTKDRGTWFASKKGRRIAAFSATYTAIWIVALVLFDAILPLRSLVPNPPFIATWVVPIVVISALTLLLYVLVRRFRPTTRESIVGLFTAFVTTYFVLTLTATFFRGHGMALTWPWNLPSGALPF